MAVLCLHDRALFRKTVGLDHSDRPGLEPEYIYGRLLRLPASRGGCLASSCGWKPKRRGPPFLLLASALAYSKPGDKIPLACYGDGCTLLILEVTEENEKENERPRIRRYLSVAESYGWAAMAVPLGDL